MTNLNKADITQTDETAFFKKQEKQVIKYRYLEQTIAVERGRRKEVLTRIKSSTWKL